MDRLAEHGVGDEEEEVSLDRGIRCILCVGVSVYPRKDATLPRTTRNPRFVRFVSPNLPKTASSKERSRVRNVEEKGDVGAVRNEKETESKLDRNGQFLEKAKRLECTATSEESRGSF